MTNVAEVELSMRVSEDPSVRLGDLQDIIWEESIQGTHSVKLKMPIVSGSGVVNVPLSALMDDCWLMLLQIDKETQVRLGGSGSTPTTIKPIGRYAYFLITADDAQYLYVEPTEDAELVVCAIGN